MAAEGEDELAEGLGLAHAVALPAVDNTLHLSPNRQRLRQQTERERDGRQQVALLEGRGSGIPIGAN